MKMYEQMDIFSFLEPQKQAYKPGDWVGKEDLGKKLTFDEIAKEAGNLIVMDKSTESHEWYKVVLAEKIAAGDNGRRILVYYEGCKQRGLVDEMWFNESLRFPARAYRLKEAE